MFFLKIFIIIAGTTTTVLLFKSSIVSRVGAVIKHNENKYMSYNSDEDDEDNDSGGGYDPHRPAIHNTSSVIKVPERK